MTTPVVRWISTGRPELDAILGGGLPAGRLIELFGNRNAIRSILLPMVDRVPSHCVDSSVDAVTMLDLVRTLIRSRTPTLIVVDADALVKAYGYTDRLLSKSVREFCTSATRVGHTVVFVRAARPLESPGPVQWWEHGDRRPIEHQTGNALKFYSSVRAQITVVDDGIRVKTYKNKLHPPFKVVVLLPQIRETGPVVELIHLQPSASDLEFEALRNRIVADSLRSSGVSFKTVDQTSPGPGRPVRGHLDEAPERLHCSFDLAFDNDDDDPMLDLYSHIHDK